jgi:two-component system, chemotaxis family, protein-glutamate methylesterase/glutaminase
VALTYPLNKVRKVEQRWRRQSRQPLAAARFIRMHADDFIVAIGGSGSGRLLDIHELLEHLPIDLMAIVLIVLHRPVDAVSYLARVLERRSALPVRVARNGERLEVGHCYIGEPGQHIVFGAGSFAKLISDPTNLYRNRTVDALFYSLAEHAEGKFIGVVLSGDLDDGTRGLMAIRRAGGITMVVTPRRLPPDESMPANAISFNDPVDFIGSPRHIAAEIALRVGDKQ